MAENETEQFIDKLVLRDLSGDSVGFDKDDIEFLRANPEVVDRLSDPTVFKRKYAFVLLFLAVGLLIASKTLAYSKVLESHPILNDITTNVVFSISTDLLGATMVVFLLDLVLEKRIRHNREILDKLAAGSSDD